MAYPWVEEPRDEADGRHQTAGGALRGDGPLEDGFAGMLVEIHCHGDRYVLLETAPTSGNRLLRFSCKDKELVYAALARELGGILE